MLYYIQAFVKALLKYNTQQRTGRTAHASGSLLTIHDPRKGLGHPYFRFMEVIPLIPFQSAVNAIFFQKPESLPYAVPHRSHNLISCLFFFVTKAQVYIIR